MSDTKKHDEKLAAAVIKLTQIIVFLVLVIIVLLIVLIKHAPSSKAEVKIETPVPDEYGNFTEAGKLEAKKRAQDTVKYWQAPDEASLNGSEQKESILYGKDLISNTSIYFGEKGKIFSSTNGMNCQNCHLDAGTKVFGNNYSAVASMYPKYRARSGSIENIYKRVNDCFERSLNGKAIDTSSKEMQAIVNYIYWLGKDVQKNKKPEGSGFKELAFLDRAADPESGKNVYANKCQTCHQANGEGTMNSDGTAFTYPPLWGNKSYNDGAGLYRLSNCAKYVKYNMPLGASHNAVQISDEEAWDVAAFVNSQPRPKKDIKQDWPNIEEKPFDHPFGPFADGFSEQQHKFGPFKPMKKKKDTIKMAKK
ncbi:MAG: c-type cytochrome [Bacteroidota bacterium]|nr:c-type cytochrome [Bacteroidota bacterium]